MKILKSGIVLIMLSMTLWGCGKGNSAAPAAIDPVTGKHVTAGWSTPDVAGVPPHASAVNGYYALPTSCKECHGEKLNGGTSKVSCSNPGRNGLACHARFPHVDGFAVFSIHGNSAKSAAVGLNGMAHCQKCHGSDYTGKGEAKNCIGCHKLTNPSSNAPHAANWATYLANTRNLNHSSVDSSNAAACAQCHTSKSNLSAAGKAKLLPFTTPGPGGCFNNTLCHNQVGHTPYTVVTHQADARTNVVCGLSCHAVPATGTSNPKFNKTIATTNGVGMGIGCETCHGGSGSGLAHPYLWLPNRPGGTSVPSVTHGNRSLTAIPDIPGNILSACGNCHNVTTSGAKNGVPSCMSGSPGIAGVRCHFSPPVNPTNGTAGCISCHGDSTTNAPVGTALPNRNNKHVAHVSNISGLKCDACHNGFGPPLGTHANGTPNKSLSDIFNNGGAVISAGGCSNISCHGGIPTPPWDTTPRPNYVYDPTGGNCTANCHGTVLNNASDTPGSSYINVYNGDPNPGNLYYDIVVTFGSNNLHDFHMNIVPTLFAIPVVCTDCHGLQADKLPLSHFSGLLNGKRPLVVSDPKAAGFAAATIGGTDSAVDIYTYDGVAPGPTTRGSCVATVCHPGARYWFFK